jgi:hypothetical protein
MFRTGWKRLLADADWCRGNGRFPLRAYSEFVPPPWVGVKPFGPIESYIHDPGDNWGWQVHEYAEAHELRPGMRVIAREILEEVVKLGRGLPAPQIPQRDRKDNPYWPPELAARAGQLPHERFVVLLSLALSRTQDDKGRVRWTLFGNSEQGPARAFWQGFFTGPRSAVPAEEGQGFLRRLLEKAYGVTDRKGDLARLGLRVLPAGADPQFPFWGEERFPSWCDGLLWKEKDGLKGLRFLLTFRPFARLPAAVQQAYVDGQLHLLPFPGSLVFWGSPLYRRLQQDLPLAVQLPLLHLFPRYNDPYGIRIPPTGWLDEGGPDAANDLGGLHRPRVQRTHRWERSTRDADETAGAEGDLVTRVLFSTDSKDLGLYGKPMARNVQLWTQDHRVVLDGLRAGPEEITQAARVVAQGGRFGYRFVFPAMRVGPWEVYWHRPLAAFPDAATGAAIVLDDAPAGYLTAYPADRADLDDAVELWPRLLRRPLYREAAELFIHQHRPYRLIDALNVRSLLEHHELLGPEPLPRSLALACMEVPKGQKLDSWLASLPARAADAESGRALAAELAKRLAPAEEALPNDPLAASLTFASTSTRAFELAYWETIVRLAHGRYCNKNNGDCVRDGPTRSALAPYSGHLHALGDHLLRCHQRTLTRAGLADQGWAAEQAFVWETDFDFSWMGGWCKNRAGKGCERNLIVRIPGRDPGQAVILADHYDTAYMYDRYDAKYGGSGARVAAPGADDNHSATALLLLAAPIFLELSKAGRLACDVWLVHLTGEEFPADCLGARALCRALVERSLRVRDAGGRVRDLSEVRIRGVYDVDMIAHNNSRAPYVFQISPGEGTGSARLALEAHQANRLWNALAHKLNAAPPRRGLGPSQRIADPRQVPPPARSARLRGEIRTEWDPRSTLYNTDGQIFSDAGVPVVLFMENYDINRTGYHDTHDTVENIDLDYGAAFAAIIIETVARVAAAPEFSGARRRETRRPERTNRPASVTAT